MILTVTKELIEDTSKYFLSSISCDSTYAEKVFDKKVAIGIEHIANPGLSCTPAFLLGVLLSNLRTKKNYEHWRHYLRRCGGIEVLSAYIALYNQHNPDTAIEATHPLIRWLEDVPYDRQVFNSEYAFVGTAMKDLTKFYKKFVSTKGVFDAEVELVEHFKRYVATAPNGDCYKRLLSECKELTEASLARYYTTWGTW